MCMTRVGNVVLKKTLYNITTVMHCSPGGTDSTE